VVKATEQEMSTLGGKYVCSGSSFILIVEAFRAPEEISPHEKVSDHKLTKSSEKREARITRKRRCVFCTCLNGIVEPDPHGEESRLALRRRQRPRSCCRCSLNTIIYTSVFPHNFCTRVLLSPDEPERPKTHCEQHRDQQTAGPEGPPPGAHVPHCDDSGQYLPLQVTPGAACGRRSAH